MKQQFKEDRAELEAHFADRVQAYVELGETPEQANLSAQEKFGETDTVMRKLRWQAVLRSPIAWGLVCATGYIFTTAFWKTAAVESLFLLAYAVYLWRAPRTKKSGG